MATTTDSKDVMMFRNAALTVALLGGCVWCLALVARAEDPKPAGPAAGPSAAPPFAPVASLDSLMHGQKDHLDAIAALAGDATAKGRFRRMHANAELLAELANVNIYHNEKTDYQGWARELRDTSMLLARETDKKDAVDEKKVGELIKKIEASCKACHDVYQ